LASLLWYYYYARERVKREGAIFHWFALLGKYQYDELENEFMTILKEKGLRQGDPFDETVIRARISHIDRDIAFTELLDQVAETFVTEMHVNKEDLRKEFMMVSAFEPSMIIPEISVLYARQTGVEYPELRIVIAPKGVERKLNKHGIESSDFIRVFFFLVNPIEEPKQQLRMLTRLIDIVERDNFVKDITKLESHRQIKEFLLQNERFITLQLLKDTHQAEAMVGKELREVPLPSGVLVALIEREDKTFAPNGKTRLMEDDIVTIIGEQRSIAQLFKRFVYA